MKNTFLNLFSLLIMSSILFTACDKTMSTDEPFPDEREAMVFITPNNSKLYGYDANNGNRKMEFSLSGNSVGSPVVIGDNLYVVTDVRKLYAINLKTKKLTWVKTLPSGSKYALAADDSTLFIAGNTLLRYDTNGNQKWSYTPSGATCSSSPQVANGKIYVACETKVHCVDMLGNNVWSSTATAAGNILSSVNVSDGVVYFGAEDNKLRAINANTGANIWTFTTAAQVNSSPLVYGGMCIAGSDDNTIYCVEVLPGAGGVGQLRWSVPTAERVRSSPTIHTPSNTVLVGCHDYNLYAIDHVTGLVKWKYPAGSLIASSPVVSGNNVYFTAYDQYMYCVDVRFGSLLWKVYMGNVCEASPVVDDTKAIYYSGLSGMSTY